MARECLKAPPSAAQSILPCAVMGPTDSDGPSHGLTGYYRAWADYVCRSWPGRCCTGAAFGGAIDNGRAEYGPGAVLQSEFLTYFINSLFFFQLRRICNCCNNIFSDPTTILTEQQRYWSWKIASIRGQSFADPPTLCGQELPSLCTHIMFTMRRDYNCCDRTMGDSRLSQAPPSAAQSIMLCWLRPIIATVVCTNPSY